MPLEIIGNTDHRTFSNIGMVCQHFFELAGGQAMTGNINHIIGAGHDVEIAIGIAIAGITGFIIAGKSREIFLNKSLIRTPDGQQT